MEDDHCKDHDTCTFRLQALEREKEKFSTNYDVEQSAMWDSIKGKMSTGLAVTLMSAICILGMAMAGWLAGKMDNVNTAFHQMDRAAASIESSVKSIAKTVEDNQDRIRRLERHDAARLRYYPSQPNEGQRDGKLGGD
jgi:hypothetical protein